jgi:hypothetical protein
MEGGTVTSIITKYASDLHLLELVLVAAATFVVTWGSSEYTGGVSGEVSISFLAQRAVEQSPGDGIRSR